MNQGTSTPGLAESSVGARSGYGETVVPTARRQLFRERAIAAHRKGSSPPEALRVSPPWTVWTLAVAGLLVAAALAASVIVRVEVTSVGRGVLQSSGSPQVIAAEVGGTVSTVSLRSGDPVEAGQEILRLEQAATAASLLEATRKLELATRALDDFRQHRKPLQATRATLLRAQAGLLEHRGVSENLSVHRMGRKAKAIDSLTQAGLATPLQAEDAAEDVALAERESFRVREEGARIRDQMAALQAEVGAEEWKLAANVDEAQAHCDALRFTLEAAVIKAPSAGQMGALSVRPGDTVSPGAPLARVVPGGPPRSVAVYVPERDRAFLEVNSLVRVEVDQLPVWEFGSLHGRIARVATEMASERDLHDTFGDQVPVQEPMYRADVVLERDDAYHRLSSHLHVESLANVRFILRRRRVITVLFEPLQRWFP